MFVSRFVPSPHLLNEDDLEDKELQTGKEGDETGVRSLKREMERRSNRVCAIVRGMVCSNSLPPPDKLRK